MNQPESAYIFPNGNVAVFDENGEQIGELQMPWIRLLLKFWQEPGIDPKVIEKMDIVGWADIRGPRVIIRPLLLEDGTWNVDVKTKRTENP